MAIKSWFKVCATTTKTQVTETKADARWISEAWRCQELRSRNYFHGHKTKVYDTTEEATSITRQCEWLFLYFLNNPTPENLTCSDNEVRQIIKLSLKVLKTHFSDIWELHRKVKKFRYSLNNHGIILFQWVMNPRKKDKIIKSLRRCLYIMIWKNVKWLTWIRVNAPGQ